MKLEAYPTEELEIERLSPAQARIFSEHLSLVFFSEMFASWSDLSPERTGVPDFLFPKAPPNLQLLSCVEYVKKSPTVRVSFFPRGPPVRSRSSGLRNAYRTHDSLH